MTGEHLPGERLVVLKNYLIRALVDIFEKGHIQTIHQQVQVPIIVPIYKTDFPSAAASRPQRYLTLKARFRYPVFHFCY